MYIEESIQHYLDELASAQPTSGDSASALNGALSTALARMVCRPNNLLKRFGSWKAVRDVPTAEVEETIANVNWSEVKAPRLQKIMRVTIEERGNLDLNFLCDLP